METLMHGTCVALGGAGAVLRGPSGAGKSDLALRFLFLPRQALDAQPEIIADDQVILRRRGQSLWASCPRALRGKIEVRGVGISSMRAFRETAELKILIDLDTMADAPRLPPLDEWETVLDLQVRRAMLDPFEGSAPIKLALILQNFLGKPAD